MLPLAAAVACAPAPARACDAILVPVASTMRLDYDPFAFANTTGMWTFDVESREAQACDADLALVDPAHVAQSVIAIGTTGVAVTVEPGNGDIALAPTATPGVWRMRLDPGRRMRLTLAARITQDAIAPAGESIADLAIELREPGSVATSAAALPVSIVLATIPRAQMNIVGAAATFGEGARITQVDFGILETGASRRVFLQVRANGQARLSIASAHAGRLRRDEGSAEEEGIGYSAQFDGAIVDLTRPWAAVIAPPHSIAGASLPLDLVLGTVGPRLAGRYADVLTIELSAL